MASDPNTLRTRRALLTAAAGGAAAVAATAAMPLTAVAADPNDVVKGTDNPTTAKTSITDTGDRTTAFQATNVGVAPSILAKNAEGVATTVAETDPSDPGGITAAAGVYAVSVDDSDAAPFWVTTYTGAYGWAPTFPNVNGFSVGVWGDSDDVGHYGTGSIGAWGDGFIGVRGTGETGGIGVQAIAASPTDLALTVAGKVTFSRSNRATIGAGRSSLKVNLPGTTSSSRVFAVLHSNRAGRYVRAVVPTTGSFTIYLNTTVTSATYVAWFVLN
ncbi:MAG TPA: hypothetical protein VFN41_02010 [Candidatus Limnocylindrales bacterium]|nr:hypothetical protein [Candidatus Limnocylindrales bacterium]